MAITIDQFLQDLTERQLLSQAEAYAVRRRISGAIPERTPPPAGSDPLEPGPKPREPARALANPARLVLCDCIIQDKQQAHENHLIFSAKRLRDESPVTIHVLVPQDPPEISALPNRLNGSASSAKEHAPRPQKIVDVGRHGELLCICCESLEAETLEQLVSQNGPLPLELATETLLQTARTLQRLEAQGLSLTEVSPQQLLLDDDGRVHLMGNHLAPFLRSYNGQRSGSDPSVQRLHFSLGSLYHYLQTAKAWQVDSPSEMALSADPQWEARKSAGLLKPSALQMFARLIGQGAVSLYHGWDELIRDLESMLQGGELAAPVQPSLADREVPARELERVPSSSPSASADDSAKPKSQQALWWLIGLAILVAAIVTAISLLGD